MIHLTKRIGDGYSQLLDWKLQFSRVKVKKEFEKLVKLISEFAANSIREIEDLSKKLYGQVENLIKNAEDYRGRTVKITLTLTAPDCQELYQEIERI